MFRVTSGACAVAWQRDWWRVAGDVTELLLSALEALLESMVSGLIMFMGGCPSV